MYPLRPLLRVLQPIGMAELSVFYCEEAISFLRDCSIDDKGYYSALVRMCGQALQRTLSLAESERAPFLKRLGPVRAAAEKIGWGVGEEMTMLWYDFADDSEAPE